MVLFVLRYQTNMDGLMSVEEAARVLGIKPAMLRRYVQQGRLPAHRVGKRTFALRHEDVQAFAAVKPTVGWPKGKPRKPAVDSAPPADQQ